jgi:cyclophilin family peptidyl-prolyl cis-trans isomerase
MDSRRLCAALFLLASAALSALATETAAPPVPAPPSAPRVALDTSLGRIVFELYRDKAPRTVANFLAYVRDGHYNGTVFHRVVPELLVQGGAFTPDLQQKPERAPIPNEANNGLSNLRGSLVAARRPGDSDSATAQFFINLADNRQFDPHDDRSPQGKGYCVFGRVIEGMDVAERIGRTPTAARAPFAADVPTTAVLIERAQILQE